MTVKSDRPTSGLGRGLASLIPQRVVASGMTDLPLARIKSNPLQPRRSFDEAKLQELTDSIREHGVLQPVLVTETIDGYQLVAGERRVMAARLAGLERIPALVRQLAQRDQLEIALVENIQRADLDPIEEANAYRQLIDEFGLTQDEIAARVGRARATVTNTIRLLELDPAIQAAIVDGRITEGHARAIGGLPTERQAHVLPAVVEQGLSVRQTEELVRRIRDAREAPATVPRDRDPDVERVEEELRRALGTKVSLNRSRKGGRIVIEFYSEDELARLYERLVGQPA